MAKYNVIADVALRGHLRYGHWELELDESEYNKFKNLDKEKQIEWIRDYGDLICDDYSIEDHSEIDEIDIVKKEEK